MRGLCRDLVVEDLRRASFPRLTFDFDGSVQSTKGHAEGAAVGFNPKKKGARSYSPLFCTVAQTGRFFDLHHRPGNMHDSNGAFSFMADCFEHLWREFAGVKFESRVDGAFFNLETLRRTLIQRAGRLIRPQGELTPSMSANRAVRENLLHFLDAVQKAA